MPDFPGQSLVPLADDRSSLSISTYSGWCLGPAVAAGVTTTAWPLANRAIFIPFRVPVPVTVYQMACGTGTGTTGNFDLGIYDSTGSKLVSTGSTAKTTAASERIVNVTDTELLPGLYYLAMATDGITAYTTTTAPGNLGMCKQFGMRQMAAAFALPATATYATISSAYIPIISAYLRSE